LTLLKDFVLRSRGSSHVFVDCVFYVRCINQHKFKRIGSFRSSQIKCRSLLLWTLKEWLTWSWFFTLWRKNPWLCPNSMDHNSVADCDDKRWNDEDSEGDSGDVCLPFGRPHFYPTLHHNFWKLKGTKKKEFNKSFV
jgi:hypothetical protein